ncbi:porin family protein [Balneolaceae bacterium ANBcel3]|nr:porin family protein [Balneolaceae bacterium ANBcel3]
MKNIVSITLIPLVCFLLFSATLNMANAQNRDASPLSWGPKVGVTVSDMFGDDVGTTSMRTGFTGGVFVNYRVSPAFSVQPEVLFTMKNIEAGVLGGPQTEYDFGYLEIPVLLKNHFETSGPISPNFYVGPSLAIQLYGEADGENIKDNLEPIDFGIVVGGGVDIIDRINLDLRYTIGVKNAFDLPQSPSAKVGSLQITMGFSI